MIRGVHHTAVSTPDLDRLAAFYTDLFGFEPVLRHEWSGRPTIDEILGLDGSAARQVMLKAGNAYLELFQFTSPAPTPRPEDRQVCDHGYTHICLDVTDIAGEISRLEAGGMTFLSGPIDTGPTLAVYGRDPDGNVIELQEFKSDA